MMHRRPLVRARVSLRSISDWLCKSQPHYHHHHHGPRLASQKLDSPRTLTTSNGHQVMWHGTESITRSVQMQIVDALRLGERGRASNMLLNLNHVNHSLGADDFLHILKYCARSPDPLFVMETWRVMDEKEITLNNLCSLLMMQALCRGGYLEEAFKLINFLGESQGIYPVLPIYNSFLRACAKMQSMINANQCLDLMEHQMVGKNEVTYSELLKLRNDGLAEQLILQMQNFGLQPSSHTYDGFVRAVASQRGFSIGMEILQDMQQRNLKPYDSTLVTLSIGCSKVLELNLAEALLDQISECSYPHPFNAFFAACDTTDQPERAVQMLAKMKQLEVMPNINTYELLFLLFGNVNAPYEEGNMLSQVDAAKRINAIEMDMARYSIQHSYLSMNNLLKALGTEGMIRELIQYLHVAENLFCRNNVDLGTPIYNTALHSLVEANESQMAIKIFKSMKSFGFPADAATYNIMIDCCSILKCYRSASALISMMLRDGFYPVTVTYTALIKILLEDDDIDEALNLLDQASSEGNKLDSLLFNTILQKACEKELIEAVELVVEWMHQEKIQPDPGTCHFVFSAYVNCGFHSTAMEALQVLSMRMICNEDGSFPEKAEYEDDFIFAEDMEAESRIVQLFEDSEENLAAALLNLRWCAVLGFPISWSPSESPWARRLSFNYTTRKGAA